MRVPLYRRNSVEAHEHMIRHTGSKVVVVSQEYAHEVASLAGTVDGLRIVVRDAGYEAWLAGHEAADPDLAFPSTTCSSSGTRPAPPAGPRALRTPTGPG